MVAFASPVKMPELGDFKPEPGNVVKCDYKTIIIREWRFFGYTAAISFSFWKAPKPYAVLWVDGTLFLDWNHDGILDTEPVKVDGYDICEGVPDVV